MSDFSKRIFFRAAGMAACARSRLHYREVGGEPLAMNIYAPSKPPSGAPRPAVFFVHGGPIPPQITRPTEWGIFQSYGELIAASGRVGVTFDHRLFSFADYEQSRSDVSTAIEYVRAHADELHVDPSRIALWLFSGAGAHLSWLLRELPPGLRCVLAFYPVVDIPLLLPADADDGTHSLAKRFSIVSSGAPLTPIPVFIARAGLDLPQINAGIDAWVATALTQNLPFDLLNHTSGRHGFDYLDDHARTHEITRAALAFLNAQLDAR
jgi:dienelactone hydrolase